MFGCSVTRTKECTPKNVMKNVNENFHDGWMTDKDQLQELRKHSVMSELTQEEVCTLGIVSKCLVQYENFLSELINFYNPEIIEQKFFYCLKLIQYQKLNLDTVPYEKASSELVVSLDNFSQFLTTSYLKIALGIMASILQESRLCLK